ncbi:MAG: FtsW/RodA/SpoVE family cell cycle protein, partial [Chitinivibrionia bacterium]|nr:FtsW/RodA/SpoVE family cell cycle protein [Chitinivibrionia bacterium]
EAGLIGTVLVSACFLFLVLRTMKMAQKCGDVFGEMLAVGFGSALFIYAALNMAVATQLFPVTGLPLPFISFGGSALVVNSVSIGILLSISRQSKRSTRFAMPARLSPRGRRREPRMVDGELKRQYGKRAAGRIASAVFALRRTVAGRRTPCGS